MTREEAFALLEKHNKSISLIHHALCVEATMKEFAKVKGEDVEYWGLVGLLHDVDYEEHPDQHCHFSRPILEEIGASDEFIHAVESHGYGICIDTKPELYMEKVLYAIDELTGLVYATALMRPEHMEGMSVKSVMKKWKNPNFSAGVRRDLIQNGVENLGDMELAQVIQHTIDAMSAVSTAIGL